MIQGTRLVGGEYVRFQDGTVILFSPVWPEIFGMTCRGAYPVVKADGIDVTLGSEVFPRK